jgi:putative membrane protein
MLYIKALHIIFLVTWFAGLFYLPRLFVYHAEAHDEISIERFILMERKLYYGIMMPGAFLTVFFGGYLLYLVPSYLHMGWLHIKLSLILLLIFYHLYLGHLRQSFKLRKNKHGHKFYRLLNEIPVLFLIAIVILAVVKPL